MKKCRLFLGLILLLYTLNSVAQASFFTNEESGQRLDLNFSNLYIENILYHEGQILAQKDGILYAVQEDGSYIFLAQLPQVLDKSGKILLDEGKLLYFSGEAFYHLTLGENPDISPVYEDIFVPNDSITRIFANQKQIIYLCRALNETGKYAIQYSVEKAGNQVQKTSNRYTDAIQNLYKEEGLFAYFGANDNYLGVEAGLYRLLDNALQRLPYGGEDTETLGKLNLRHLLYHPELDAFFATNDSYLYRITKDSLEKVAINLNYFANPFLLDEQGDIRMPSPKGYVRIPKNALLDTSNILSVHAFYEPELLYAFQELGKGCQITLAEEGDNNAYTKLQ